jgi:hypothetical protein
MATPQSRSDDPMDFAMPRASASPPAMPQFDGMESEPELKAPPRDYAADFDDFPHRATERNQIEQGIAEQEMVERDNMDQYMAEQAQGPEASLFPEAVDNSERDLDVPTFLRRLKF